MQTLTQFSSVLHLFLTQRGTMGGWSRPGSRLLRRRHVVPVGTAVRATSAKSPNVRHTQGRSITVDPQVSETITGSPSDRCHRRRGFTLVELLVVISIVSLLVAILLPALGAARNSARKAFCQSNLRQLGISIVGHAQRDGRHTFCTGAFDWKEDGSVTDVSWVADLVKLEIPVGDMLCAANPARVSETFDDLLNWGPPAATACGINYAGSPPQTLPDGTQAINPCRKIVEGTAGDRRALVESEILKRKYNTNYIASWFLVRSDVVLGDDGNPKKKDAACSDEIKSRNVTRGPLNMATMDTANVSSSMIPFLADAAPVRSLSQPLGRFIAGEPLAKSYTNGPVVGAVTPGGLQPLAPPYNDPPLARNGPGGWWAMWNRYVLQDYRGFQPVHGGVCNILFADGSVRAFTDLDKDGYLDNGFTATTAVELPTDDVTSLYSLQAVRLAAP